MLEARCSSAASRGVSGTRVWRDFLSCTFIVAHTRTYWLAVTGPGGILFGPRQLVPTGLSWRLITMPL